MDCGPRPRPPAPATHSKPQPHNSEQTTRNQIGLGKSILARKTLHNTELATNAKCNICIEEDSVSHLLTECPEYADERTRLWDGLLPSLGCVLGGTA